MTFKDAKGRSIEIGGDYNIEAFHNGKCIGRVEFDERDGDVILWGMTVDDVYRRAGIATAMMRQAAELHGKSFGKPSFLATGGLRAGSETYYTQEGAALIQHCIREGILDNTEPGEPDLDDEE